jgi:hypothetical protein
LVGAASSSPRASLGCYAAGGCADIINGISSCIDARTFNPSFPKVFPRFVQHAICYCAADGLNMCNGNRIQLGP